MAQEQAYCRTAFLLEEHTNRVKAQHTEARVRTGLLKQCQRGVVNTEEIMTHSVIARGARNDRLHILSPHSLWWPKPSSPVAQAREHVQLEHASRGIISGPWHHFTRTVFVAATARTDANTSRRKTAHPSV